jgi:hypothetical protein
MSGDPAPQPPTVLFDDEKDDKMNSVALQASAVTVKPNGAEHVRSQHGSIDAAEKTE